MVRLSQLEPANLWQLFEKICSIPHPSKHEQKISLWIKSWAYELGLSITEDAVGNLIIKKPASAGMEDRKALILQAHMDMVPQKNNDIEHDFLIDAIKPYIIDSDHGSINSEKWVTAEGTTLGADNGIGLASALAILASNDITHGPLELLITINEEAGMTGAFGLETGLLEGEILINTDSEQEGEIFMGCAGGTDCNVSFSLAFENVQSNYQAFNLSIFGLKGGHSGVDIHTGRANANKLLIQFLLYSTIEFDIKLTELNGGSLRNAIPREANASFVIAKDKVEALKVALAVYLAKIKANLTGIETDINILLISSENFDRCWTKATQTDILRTLNDCPNGVVRMSDDVDGVVETSLNLGVIDTQGSKFNVMVLIRSLDEKASLDTQQAVQSIFELVGAKVIFSGAYPGWRPNTNSSIMHVIKEVYQKLFNKDPEIKVIHAGLECGLFKKSYPHWDMISIGPTIKHPHSPDEKVNVGSVMQYWQLLVTVLANIPKK